LFCTKLINKFQNPVIQQIIQIMKALNNKFKFMFEIEVDTIELE